VCVRDGDDILTPALIRILALDELHREVGPVALFAVTFAVIV
jgi:hypothetical protein